MGGVLSRQVGSTAVLSAANAALKPRALGASRTVMRRQGQCLGIALGVAAGRLVGGRKEGPA